LSSINAAKRAAGKEAELPKNFVQNPAESKTQGLP
jgi:hypothetical protein